MRCASCGFERMTVTGLLVAADVAAFAVSGASAAGVAAGAWPQGRGFDVCCGAGCTAQTTPHPAGAALAAAAPSPMLLLPAARGLMAPTAPASAELRPPPAAAASTGFPPPSGCVSDMCAASAAAGAILLPPPMPPDAGAGAAAGASPLAPPAVPADTAGGSSCAAASSPRPSTVAARQAACRGSPGCRKEKRGFAASRRCRARPTAAPLTCKAAARAVLSDSCD